MALDWAAREHLSASDNPVERRERPSFIRTANQPGESHQAGGANDVPERTAGVPPFSEQEAATEPEAGR